MKRKAAVESAPISHLEKETKDNILALLPPHLRNRTNLKAEQDKLFEEVHALYEDSMQRLMGKHEW